MDPSKYTFRVVGCASLLDEIEPRLGVKFDRKELFDHEQSLVDQSRSGPRIMGVCWTFKFSKTGSYVHFFTSKEAKEGEIKECGCRNHVQITSRRLGYGINALECALDDLRGGISKIQALRQPKPAQGAPMDLSKYNFYAQDCATKLDQIESALGVKFDRQAMFDREQALWEQLSPGSIRRQWVFKFSKDPSITTATFDDREPGEIGTTTTETHIEYAPRGMIYAKDALLCSLNCLSDNIPDIRARRQPKPARDKQMTTQDKETIMHESIARASLIAFAEFIGQPISDLDATFRQARGLYGRVGPIACVVKIPVDKTKPIEATAVNGGPINDGVELQDGVVRASYYLGGSKAQTFKSCVTAACNYAPEALKILTTERAKQTPPPPAKSEPIPYESECRAHIKRLNKELGINLNEDAVLAAGEAVRSVTPRSSSDDTSTNYSLSIRNSDRAASFSAVLGDPDRGKRRLSGVAVWTTNYCACENGLRCALSDIVRNIPQILRQLTPPAPSKPALTADDMRPGSVALDDALEIPGRPPVYVFGGKESERQSDDNNGFFAALTSGATNLFLTFQRKADRAQLSKNPRVHVHTSPTPFLPEFNTTISAPIDPANPGATLTALAERITAENL